MRIPRVTVSDFLRVAVAGAVFCVTAPLGADEPPRPAVVNPATFGFEIPVGPLKAGAEQTVSTRDADGNTVVGKLYVEVGDSIIVLLPDGQLVARNPAECAPSIASFAPLPKEEIAQRLVAKSFPKFKHRESRRYLYLYNCSDDFATQASKILEPMFPGVVSHAESLKIEVHPPPVPMVVIMFATEEEFQNYRRMPPGVVAYYDPVSNRVVMYEQAEVVQVRPDIARCQSLSTIAHEGAHQILHNIGVQKRLSVWPIWLSEGLAEYFAPTSTGKRLQWKGAGQVNDLRMFELEQYIQGQAAENPDRDAAQGTQMIKDTVLAARLTSTGYAAAWSLTHFLAKRRRAKFSGYVQEVSKLGPLETTGDILAPGIVKENMQLFEKHFGTDLPALEKQLVMHLEQLPYNDPLADRPYVVAMVAYREGRRDRREVSVFRSQELAEKWTLKTIEKIAVDQRPAASRDVRLFPSRVLAEQFAQAWRNGD